jgi:hypothetical protein
MKIVQPAQNTTINSGRASQANDYLFEHPIFSFQKIIKGYKVENLQKKDQAALACQLEKLSNLTWNELVKAPHRGLGCEKISGSINVIIPECFKSMPILAFKYSGKLSMIGAQESNVYHIIGIDTNFNHSCYPHGS